MNPSRALLGAFLLILSACTPAEPDGQVEMPLPQEAIDYFTVAEQRALGDTARAWIRELYRDWNEGKYEEAFALYEEPSGIFGSEMMASWENRKAMEMENLAALSRFSQELDTITVHAISPDVAVVMGKDHYEAVSKEGKEQKGSTTFTLVLARREAGWRVVHFHVVTP